jgi:hypothetical protein
MPSYVPSTCDDNFFIIQAATVSDFVMLISPTFLTSSFSANIPSPLKYKSKTEKLLIRLLYKKAPRMILVKLTHFRKWGFRSDDGHYWEKG